MKDRALILGGGGVAGIAWLTGLMAGFRDRGVNVLDADMIIATSAGSTAGAQLTSGIDIEDLFARQVDPALQVNEPQPDAALQAAALEMRPILLAAGDRDAVIRARCAFALEARTVPEADRRAVIAARLPVHEWPEQPLGLTAVDAETGELRVFDRDSGVELVDAVAASSAVPAVWPATTIQGRRYIDGGVCSPENAVLAAGYARVLLTSPVGEDFPGTPPRDLRADITALEASGSRVLLLQPDAASRAAMTANLLDPQTREPSARAGRAQGRAEAASVAAFWTSP